MLFRSPHIQHHRTAKAAWEALDSLYVGNESSRRNRFEALSNEADGFYMLDGEDHQDMYRRLCALATTFREHGAIHVDDTWIKRKYINCYNYFEPADIKSLQGRHNYHTMTSNEVMQEMQSYKVAAKNSIDSRNRAIGMHKGANLALKAVVIEDVEALQEGEEIVWRSDTLQTYL